MIAWRRRGGSGASKVRWNVGPVEVAADNRGNCQSEKEKERSNGRKSSSKEEIDRSDDAMHMQLLVRAKCCKGARAIDYFLFIFHRQV